jgi:glycosyltransferase involved in cell wall biosynthesis
MKPKKNAIVCVTNDLSNDRRVDNTCNLLTETGFRVTLVGRHRKNSKPLAPRAYRMRRMHLIADKSFWFYAEYNLRLFFFLLFRPASLILANDLDTLWPARLVSKLRGIHLVYDTHEFFTGVPELMERPRVRAVWEKIERRIFPSLRYVITVNDSIAALYKDLYNKELYVVRNMPPRREKPIAAQPQEAGIPAGKHILLLQGAWINRDRGGEEAVQAMAWVQNAVLLVIGSGDVIGDLKHMALADDIKDKVIFMDRQPFEKLIRYTAMADIGLSLDKDTNINYRYSLPNKLFDYIQAGVPVLASPLVEVEKIVTTYQVGRVIPSHQPQEIAAVINEMLQNPDQLREYKDNCLKAAEILCWENERKAIAGLYRSLYS